MSSIAIAESIVTVVGVYIGCGIVFAFAFLVFGVGRVDPTAEGSSYGFRALILPGTVALWPLLAIRWARGGSFRPTERNPHRDAARQEASR
jgi:hypothetical protein